MTNVKQTAETIGIPRRSLQRSLRRFQEKYNLVLRVHTESGEPAAFKIRWDFSVKRHIRPLPDRGGATPKQKVSPKESFSSFSKKYPSLKTNEQHNSPSGPSDWKEIPETKPGLMGYFRDRLRDHSRKQQLLSALGYFLFKAETHLERMVFVAGQLDTLRDLLKPYLDRKDSDFFSLTCWAIRHMTTVEWMEARTWKRRVERTKEKFGESEPDPLEEKVREVFGQVEYNTMCSADCGRPVMSNRLLCEDHREEIQSAHVKTPDDLTDPGPEDSKAFEAEEDSEDEDTAAAELISTLADQFTSDPADQAKERLLYQTRALKSKNSRVDEEGFSGVEDRLQKLQKEKGLGLFGD